MTSPLPSTTLGSELTGQELKTVQRIADQFGVTLRHFFRRRVREPEEVDDLVQEVLIRLLRRGRVADVIDLRGYLFQTAASVLTDRARKRRSHHAEQHEPFDQAQLEHEGFPADRVLIGEEMLTHTARALLELPERARTIFILRRLEGLRYQDIANRLGISLSLVEKQMARAAAYLKQRMSEE